MPKLTIFLACEKLLEDKETNLTSIINLIDGLTPSGLPLVIPEFYLFLYFNKDIDENDKYDVNIKVKLNRDTLYDNNLALDFMDKQKAKMNLRMLGFPINQVGKLSFEAFINEELLNQFEIIINEVRIIPKVEEK